MAATPLGRRAAGAAAALLLALAPQPALPGDPAAGKARSASCALCHGEDGLSRLPDTPHLAGQPEPYLVEQLKAFRSGKRRSEVMNVEAKRLGNQEIEDLAAYYASLTIRVEPARR